MNQNKCHHHTKVLSYLHSRILSAQVIGGHRLNGGVYSYQSVVISSEANNPVGKMKKITKVKQYKQKFRLKISIVDINRVKRQR